ncbi:Oligopeptide transport ATP-binding protein OppD [Geobacillus sp. BCO2]|nr:Oligopeptide transport ATP-binding protein OppD [Geobacillus sp. BCO2]
MRKSALALSIMGLHPPEKTKVEGRLLFKGTNLLSLSVSELNRIRGKEIGMIFQDPLTALNPLMTVGRQIEESMNYHLRLPAEEKRNERFDFLSELAFPSRKKCITVIRMNCPGECGSGWSSRLPSPASRRF